MEPDDLTNLLRAHAKARLRGDTTEARRFADQIQPNQIPTHLVFLFPFFGSIALDHFGDDLDRSELAALTRRLHDKHTSTVFWFNAMRAEAMVRAIYGEARLMIEMPISEQLSYMWAVLDELVDPDITDTELDARFAFADELGTEWTHEALASPLFTRLRDHGRTQP